MVLAIKYNLYVFVTNVLVEREMHTKDQLLILDVFFSPLQYSLFGTICLQRRRECTQISPPLLWVESATICITMQFKSRQHKAKKSTVELALLPYLVKPPGVGSGRNLKLVDYPSFFLNMIHY